MEQDPKLPQPEITQTNPAVETVHATSATANLHWTTVVKVRLQLFFQAIKPHWFQFLLLAILSGNIGAVYATTDFCQAYMAGTAPYNIYYESSYTVSTSFLVSFGAVKAVCNLITGMLADRVGRRFMHALGWAFGILLPVMIIAGKNWPTMVAADVFLGVQQGLSWTSAVFMLIDYATRRNAGVGVGVSEFPILQPASSMCRHAWPQCKQHGHYAQYCIPCWSAQSRICAMHTPPRLANVCSMCLCRPNHLHEINLSQSCNAVQT